MEKNEPQIITTDDGSSTIYLPELDETYHSKFGAINEATHVFIDNGLKHIFKDEIRVFEIGFGTGLNALLTNIFASDNKKNIIYRSLEKHPLDQETFKQLNYGNVLNQQVIFEQLHQAAWNKTIDVFPNFTLSKIKGDLLDSFVALPTGNNIIYFDAFAPSKQPDLWTEEIFTRLKDTLVIGGVLVTYSAAGVVKRTLRGAGFKVKRLTGPPGKHHMVMAKKV